MKLAMRFEDLSARTHLAEKLGSIVLMIVALSALALIAMIALASVWFIFLKELP